MMGRRPIQATLLLVAASLTALAMVPAGAKPAPGQQSGSEAPRRFMAELAAFAEKDAGLPAQAGGVLFLGSSSVRLWDLRASFPTAHTVNRGFGGSTVTDVLASYDVLVAKQRPDSIVVYVGENDIALGRGAGTVARDVARLMARLRSDYPDARIAYLSMKYAPARKERHGTIKRANRLIERQARKTGSFAFVDVASDLLGEEGPDQACYGPDRLHLSTIGYERWNRIVGDYLAAIVPQAQAVPTDTLKAN